MMIPLGPNWVMAENVTHVSQNGQNVSIFVAGRMPALGAATNTTMAAVAAEINAALGPGTGPVPGSSS